MNAVANAPSATPKDDLDDFCSTRASFNSSDTENVQVRRDHICLVSAPTPS